MEELENGDTPNSIAIFLSGNSNYSITNQDSGQEDNEVINNLPGSQLRVEYGTEGEVDSFSRRTNFSKLCST